MVKLFDNTLRVHRVHFTSIVNAVQTVEVDLELPRGYVAKIHYMRIRFVQTSLDVSSADATQTIRAALIRDPDDQTTVEIPNNTVEHDVLCSLECDVEAWNTENFSFHTPLETEVFVREDLDIVTARNMRFNATGSAATPGCTVECVFRYTLEKVPDQRLMDLLDIL